MIRSLARSTLVVLFICISSFFGGVFGQSICAAAVNWLSLIGGISGTATGSSCIGGATCWDVNTLNVTSDTVTAGSGTLANGLGVHHAIGAGATGMFNGIYSSVQIAGATGNSNGAYVSQLALANAIANDNGTLGTPAGSLWASNPNAFLSNGATFWLQLIGQEIDVTAGPGSSVADKLGSMVVQGSADAVVGSRSNIGYSLTNQSGAQGWDCGFCFGNYSGAWPLTATSTMYGCWPHGIARNGAGSAVPTSSGCGTTLYGMDLSNITFAAGGAPYLAPLITPASSGSTCKQGSLEWDASFIYICTASNTWKRATLATF